MSEVLGSVAIFILGFLLGGAIAMKWAMEDVRAGVFRCGNGDLYSTRRIWRARTGERQS